jgi:hypothetical protein
MAADSSTARFSAEGSSRNVVAQREAHDKMKESIGIEKTRVYADECNLHHAGHLHLVILNSAPKTNNHAVGQFNVLSATTTTPLLLVTE